MDLKLPPSLLALPVRRAHELLEHRYGPYVIRLTVVLTVEEVHE
jgi:hypothetical protein